MDAKSMFSIKFLLEDCSSSSWKRFWKQSNVCIAMRGAGSGRVVKRGEQPCKNGNLLKTKPSPKSVSSSFCSSYVVYNSLCYLATESDCMFLCSSFRNCIQRQAWTHLSSSLVKIRRIPGQYNISQVILSDMPCNPSNCLGIGASNKKIDMFNGIWILQILYTDILQTNHILLHHTFHQVILAYFFLLQLPPMGSLGEVECAMFGLAGFRSGGLGNPLGVEAVGRTFLACSEEFGARGSSQRFQILRTGALGCTLMCDLRWWTLC